MDLRKKALIIIIVFIVIMTAIMYGVVELTFLDGYYHIEQQKAEEDANRALKALKREMVMLDACNNDWAPWDETYSFLKDYNDDYIERNLVDETFMNLKINFIIFIDNHGQIVFGKGFDLNKKREMEIPKSLEEYLSKNPILVTHSYTESSKIGIIMVKEGPLFISSRPVLTSLGEGPIAGTIIMAKYIDDRLIGKIWDETGLSIDIESLENLKIPIDFEKPDVFLNKDHAIFIELISKNWTAAYILVKDLYEKPAFVIKINVPRITYQNTHENKKYFLFLLVTACWFFGILTLWLFNKAILSPSIEQETLLNTIPTWVYFKDKSFHYIVGNRGFCENFNISKEDIKGKTDFQLFPKPEAEIYHREDMEIIRSKKERISIEHQTTLPNGRIIWTSTSKAPYFDEKGEVKGIVGITTDITQHKEAQEKINYLIYRDPLTDLPNRRLFQEYLHDALREWEKNAVLYLDLDGFKRINEVLGHDIGDELLITIAERLLSCINKEDVLSRVGGDEFAILLHGVYEEEEIKEICNNILKKINEPLKIRGYEINISSSMGIAVSPKDGKDPQTILKNGEIAMYRGKEEGKNNYRFYVSSLSAEAEEQLFLENRLKMALKNEEFILYYQPQMDTVTNKIIGVEALIRWNHPDLGILSPKKFIPFAEKWGLIVPIGEWVLRKACKQAKDWNGLGSSPIQVSVNLSPKQFQQRNITNTIASILEETGLDPTNLEIEITESMAMKNVETTVKILEELQKMGINIALDDFGKGYSCLNYLKQFPINKIKIDQSFIRYVTANDGDAVIVATIIGLSKNINMKVLAEGVETYDQLEFLKEAGCDEIQGYIFSKPVPPEVVEKMLKDQ